MRHRIRTSVRILKLDKMELVLTSLEYTLYKQEVQWYLNYKASRHHYTKTRTLDINNIPSIHPQPNCAPIKVIVHKDEHKANIYKHRKHRKDPNTIICIRLCS